MGCRSLTGSSQNRAHSVGGRTISLCSSRTPPLSICLMHAKCSLSPTHTRPRSRARARTLLCLSPRNPVGSDRVSPKSLRAAALGKALRALDLVLEPPHVLSATRIAGQRGRRGLRWVPRSRACGHFWIKRVTLTYFIFYPPVYPQCRVCSRAARFRAVQMRETIRHFYELTITTFYVCQLDSPCPRAYIPSYKKKSE